MKWRLWLWIMAAALAAPMALYADENDDKGEETKSDEKKTSPIPRLVELRLDEYLVPARMINVPFPGRTKTLQDVLDRIDKWTEDERIGGVLLDVGLVNLSLPDVQELRTAIGNLREKGKTVRAFLNGGSPNAYLLACAADEITMAPSGFLAIPGFGYLFPYMKGYYQMMGIEFDVITAGKYKYPGFVNRREPDQYFNEEFGAILDSWIDDYVQMIAKSRNLSEEKVREAIDTALFSGTQAQQYGLVDKLAYYDEYRDVVCKREKMKRYHEWETDLSRINSIQDLMQLINDQMQEAAEARKAIGPKIAVLHARGPIIDFNLGPGFASMFICRDDFVKVVDELRKNDSIKAVVMHVDSPGGSGYASDVIWQHLRQLDETKPLVVSMGAVAGSGGYYIACPGRRIFAQPTTITGSIGVIAMLASQRSMFNRMDWEMAEMTRGERANLGAPHREMSTEDRAFIQKYMNDFYAIFLERVATTRKMPEAEVDKIAQGRIWTGRDALDIGLVDELGGLTEAIESARRLANIPPSAELKIVHYPRSSSLGELVGSLGMMGVSQAVETMAKLDAPATTITFDQQLRMFSQRIQPLCWMAIPPFYTSATSGWQSMMPTGPQSNPGIEQMLTGQSIGHP